MNTPVGRAIRVLLGLALIGVGLLVGGTAGIVLAVVALAPIATGVFGLCPINPLVGQPMRACAVPTRHRARHA
jgi:hypothetical protein